MKNLFTQKSNSKFIYMILSGIFAALLLLSIVCPLFKYELTILGSTTSESFGFFTNNDYINYALLLPIVLGIATIVLPLLSVIFIKVDKKNKMLFNTILPISCAVFSIISIILFFSLPTHTDELLTYINFDNATGSILIIISLLLSFIMNTSLGVVNLLIDKKIIKIKK